MSKPNVSPVALRLTSLTAGVRPQPKNPLDFTGKKAQKEWDVKASKSDALLMGVAASVAGSLTVSLVTGVGNLAISGVKLAVNKAKVKRATKNNPSNNAVVQQPEIPAAMQDAVQGAVLQTLNNIDLDIEV